MRSVKSRLMSDPLTPPRPGNQATEPLRPIEITKEFAQAEVLSKAMSAMIEALETNPPSNADLRAELFELMQTTQISLKRWQLSIVLQYRRSAPSEPDDPNDGT
jgi:hypothetical protein